MQQDEREALIYTYLHLCLTHSYSSKYILLFHHQAEGANELDENGEINLTWYELNVDLLAFQTSRCLFFDEGEYC